MVWHGVGLSSIYVVMSNVVCEMYLTVLMLHYSVL